MSDELKCIGDGGDLRQKLVSTAVKFLTNPDVLRLTNANKEQFLRSKGLSDAEIRAAIAKASEMLNIQSFSTDVMLFQRRNNWFRDNILPVIVYGGFAYGAYWFYKNCIRQMLFVEKPKTKSTAECLKELKESIDALSGNIETLRREVQEGNQQSRASAVRSQLDTIKSEVASVKGILLNRNQFPSLKTRSEAPSIPAWQRQSEEATSTAPTSAEGDTTATKPRQRSHRSESGGSNSSEGEQATKNSDSSLEIIT